MPILQVKHLSKSYGKIAALRDVSFDVQPGELLALIGPNGAGKSTLFDCMAGLLPADSGSVTPANQLFYVPDGISPWPAHPLSWALDFAIGYFGGRPELRADVIQQLDLKPFLHQPIGALSKGQRKRGLLAMGLLTPHPILLIDEPLDGLDLRQMRDVAQVLQHHAAAGRTLFLSIHQIADAARFCHRFILLSSGQVRGEGTLEALTALARSRDNSRPYDNLEEVFLALT